MSVIWVKSASHQVLQVGFLFFLLFLKQANQQTNTHIYGTLKYCNMPSEPERAYLTLCKKVVAFDRSSISSHPTQISFLCITYLRGKNTYCFFFGCVKPGSLKENNVKSFRGYDPRSLKRWYHTWYSQYITWALARLYVCEWVCVLRIHIYRVLEQSCREESLSMLVQHGKPPSLSGFSS